MRTIDDDDLKELQITSDIKMPKVKVLWTKLAQEFEQVIHKKL